MPHIETIRGKFWVQDNRKGDDRPPLILIHGAGGIHIDFPAQLRKQSGLPNVAIDLSGHGRSEGMGHEDLIEYAHDVHAIMTAMGIESAVIVGHSMGGAITLLLAIHYADYIEGVVLIGTGASFKVNPAIIESIVDDQQATAEMVVKWVWGEDAPADYIATGIERMMQIPPQVIRADYVACDKFDVRASLPTIGHDALIIGGGRDKMTRQKQSQELHDKMPRTQLEVLDTGHMIQLESPVKVTELIQMWYAKYVE